MEKNKIFIICLILCLCFSIQAIFAEDGNSTVCQDSQTVEFDGTTFSELQNEIYSLNDGDTLIINNDIAQDNTNAIEIKKNITISGKDITINAQNKSGIFIVKSDNVMINNITFTNGNSNQGGAIYSFANLVISNCKFINNYAGGIYGEGGSIYTLENLTIIESLFENNYASAGGAIFSYCGDTFLYATKLIDNCAKWYGGAIYHDSILRIKSCLFANNTAYSGGAIHYTVTSLSWDLGGDVIVSDSNFTQNTANFGGATSTSSIFTMTYDNCRFIDNYANKGAVTYKNAITRNYYNNCLIEANSAEEGGVIYDDSKVDSFDYRSIIFITDSTLKNNRDSGKSSIFYARDCSIVMNNTTVISNSNNPIYNGKGNVAVVNSGIFNNSGIFITQFYCGNITVVNNTWDKKDPKVDEIINCTSNSTVIYSNSDLPVDISYIWNSELSEINPVEMDCASTVVRVNGTEYVISHRRDGGDNYNMTIYVDYRDDYVIQFKAQLAYFFLSKVYTNGWLMGTGGWDSSAENEKIEAIGTDMVLNENINMEALQLIQDTKKISGAGHFIIVSPNGTYGNTITYPVDENFIKIGVLNDGDYIISPNQPLYRQEGHLDDITDPIYSNMNLSAHDRYGKERHCILVHHVTLDGGNFTDEVYCANDDGSYVDLDNGELSDNYWFGEEYTRDCDVPIILDRKHLGTYGHKLTDTELIISDRSIYVSDAARGFDYQIALNDKDNNSLAGKEIQVSFNGGNYTAVTDLNGIAIVELSAQKEGRYNVNVIFEGDNDYSQVSNTATIDVVKESVIFTGPEYSEYYSNEFTYRAMLKTTAEKALGNKRVTIAFNGKQKYAYTDENGYLTVTLRADVPGNYDLKIEFEGDAYYSAITSHKYIKIIEKSDAGPTPVPVPEKTDSYDNNSTSKTLNKTEKTGNVTNHSNASKENKVPLTTPISGYIWTIAILALAGLVIIGVGVKRRKQ